MNGRAITIYACGLLFFVSLFVAITPIAHFDGHSRLMFTPKVIIGLLIGWGLIMTACTFLVKCKYRKRPH
jgi:hypothetical protein